MAGNETQSLLAAETLTRFAAERGLLERPEEALAQVCARLREGFAAHDWQHDLLAASTRVDPAELPAYDEDYWFAFATRVVEPPAQTPHATADDEAYADWHALSAADWLGAAEQLIQGGPGTPADADALADYAAQSQDARALRGREVTADSLAPRFRPADVLLRALGAIDSEAALTTLGAWGIPHALLRAWRRS